MAGGVSDLVLVRPVLTDSCTEVSEPISPGRLEAHVRQLAGEIGERNVRRPGSLDAAAGYIAGELTRQGYGVAEQVYEAAGVRCANLEASRTGARRPDEIILVGAHYDTVHGCPGANDNGSGVAALLEIARRFAHVGPACTVRFVAFANEEPPFFATPQQGSTVYAEGVRRRGENIRLMVSLETMGFYDERPGSQRYPPFFAWFYPKQGNFLGLVADLRSRRAMRSLARAFRVHSHFPLETSATLRFVPGVAWSDHRSFWRAGYPALMATDTAFYRYRYYHSPLDTPDKLTYGPFALASEGLFQALAALACEGG